MEGKGVMEPAGGGGGGVTQGEGAVEAKLRLHGSLVVAAVAAETPLVPAPEQWCLQERNSNRASSVKIILILFKFVCTNACTLYHMLHYYIPSPNPQKEIRPRDE